MPSKLYNREINFNGKILEEQFKWIRDDHEGTEKILLRLTDHLGNLLHEKRSQLVPERGGEWETVSNTLPNGYRQPDINRALQLCMRFMQKRGETIPVNANGAVFGTKDSYDRLITDKRTYFNEEGEPITDPGKVGITGGQGEATDKTPEDTLLREFNEEFGVDLLPTDYVRIGLVYDPFMGRMLAVFMVTTALDDLWERQFAGNVKGLVDVWRKRESLGHLAYYKEDLDAEIATGGVNSVSMMLLDLFKEFQPARKTIDVEALNLELQDID